MQVIYGNNMELCRILPNCIMPSREDALVEDTTGIGGSVPHCHGFVCPYVSKVFLGQAVTLPRQTLGS